MCFDAEVQTEGVETLWPVLKSRSVSLFNSTQRPYAPTTVPIGMLIRLIAESTIPTTLAHDR
jgi:hypothetical protein